MFYFFKLNVLTEVFLRLKKKKSKRLLDSVDIFSSCILTVQHTEIIFI